MYDLHSISVAVVGAASCDLTEATVAAELIAVLVWFAAVATESMRRGVRGGEHMLVASSLYPGDKLSSA